MSSEKIDLLVIKPGSQKELYGDLSEALTGLEPPLWTALIAAFIRGKGFKVKLVDAEVEPRDIVSTIIEHRPGLIAIVVSGTNPSASTMNMIGARAILEKIRSIDSALPTILMGLHPSALSERTLKEEPVTMVCQGEGFYTLIDLLSGVAYKDVRGLWYRENGQIKSNAMAKLIDPNALPMPAWDLLPMDKYRAHNWHSWSNKNQRLPYGVIYTSLGCPYNCSFCCINAIFGKHKIRYRSPNLVIEEIDYLVKHYAVKNIKIIDEMFALNENHVIKFCNLIIERKHDLNIWAYARVDTLNERMLKVMKQAKINWLAIGFESGSEEIRGGVTKGRFGNETITRTVKAIRNSGINIVGNFIFGLPDDNIKTMHDTLNLAKELNCEYTNFYVCMAYPGSKLYEEVNVEDLPDSWVGYSQFGYETQPLPTKYLKPSEILRFRDDAFNEFYSSERYQKMICEKFGEETLKHIKAMLKYRLKRRLLASPVGN